MHNSYESLAAALRRERELRGLTQVEVARRLRVNQQTFANWELGSLPRPARPGTRAANEFTRIVEDLAAFLAMSPLHVLRLAFTPDLDLPSGTLLEAYKQRTAELVDLIKELKADREDAERAGDSA